eukprot:7721515-Pyramimonas_sp.AAC.1
MMMVLGPGNLSPGAEIDGTRWMLGSFARSAAPETARTHPPAPTSEGSSPRGPRRQPKRRAHIGRGPARVWMPTLRPRTARGPPAR